MVTYPPSYCPYCGSALADATVEGRAHGYCPDCEDVVWHNPVPGASVSVVDRASRRSDGPPRVLLVRRAVEPGAGDWTIPGGHIERGEDPAVAAARELREETGLVADPDDLTFLEASALDPIGGKHVVSIGYVIARERTSGELRAGSDAAAARFWTVAAFERSGDSFREYFRERFERAADVLAQRSG